jgi:hypothetical protein
MYIIHMFPRWSIALSTKEDHMPSARWLSGSLLIFSFFSAVTGASAACDAVDEVCLLDYPGTIQSLVSWAGIEEWAASTNLIDRKPEIVRQFIQANNEAVNWVRDPKNRQPVIDIVRRRLPAPEGLQNPDKLLNERVERYVPQLTTKASRRALEAWSRQRWPKAVSRNWSSMVRSE